MALLLHYSSWRRELGGALHGALRLIDFYDRSVFPLGTMIQ